jgi:hypothetical protein
MIRSCNLILCCFLIGLTLNASAQQSIPPHLRRLRQWEHLQGILTGLRQRTPATWTLWTTW